MLRGWGLNLPKYTRRWNHGTEVEGCFSSQLINKMGRNICCVANFKEQARILI